MMSLPSRTTQDVGLLDRRLSTVPAAAEQGWAGTRTDRLKTPRATLTGTVNDRQPSLIPQSRWRYAEFLSIRVRPATAWRDQVRPISDAGSMIDASAGCQTKVSCERHPGETRVDPLRCERERRARNCRKVGALANRRPQRVKVTAGPATVARPAQMVPVIVAGRGVDAQRLAIWRAPRRVGQRRHVERGRRHALGAGTNRRRADTCG